MDIIEERAMIDRVLSGDKDAFEALVIDNQRKVYNLALKMLKNEQDALDISQDAFIKAYTNLSSFRSDSKFSVWIYRMTYNLCVDMLRKSGRANVISLSQEDDSGEVVQLDIPDTNNDPVSLYEKKEMAEEISAGLSVLPPDQREILLLREISGLSYTERAEALHIREGTVKSRIARARGKLSEFLIKRGTFPSGYRHNGEEVSSV